MSNAHKDRYKKGFQGYETPPQLINAILEGIGDHTIGHARHQFDLDVCCSSENIPAKKHFIYPKTDALKENWEGLCWMNPPYGADLRKFVEKANNEWLEDRASIIALLPVRLENKYYHDIILENCEVIYLIAGKLKFEIDGKAQEGRCPVPSMLAFWMRSENWRMKYTEIERALRRHGYDGTLIRSI